jgi:hypothetical protein
MHPTNQEIVSMLLFLLCGTLAFVRWAKGGRLFVAFQAAAGIPWIVYGIYAYNHGSPNYLGMVAMAGWWTVLRTVALFKHNHAEG